MVDMIEVMPSGHPDPEVEATRPYITAVVLALLGEGIVVRRSWLDPRGPRDATIVFGVNSALVWDEETGWRRGEYVSGEQGERTVLARAAALGGGVLPPGTEVAARVKEDVRLTPEVYRKYTDICDGFEVKLSAVLAPAR
jgi:hypothetical protein